MHISSAAITECENEVKQLYKEVAELKHAVYKRISNTSILRVEDDEQSWILLCTLSVSVTCQHRGWTWELWGTLGIGTLDVNATF